MLGVIRAKIQVKILGSKVIKLLSEVILICHYWYWYSYSTSRLRGFRLDTGILFANKCNNSKSVVLFAFDKV